MKKKKKCVNNHAFRVISRLAEKKKKNVVCSLLPKCEHGAGTWRPMFRFVCMDM